MEKEPKQISKRFYRSKQDRYIGGVCGGLGQYFAVDSHLVRVVMLVLALMGGTGIILYVVALGIVPEAAEENVSNQQHVISKNIMGGILCIFLGAFFLSKELRVFEYLYPFQLSWAVTWAIFLIAIGVALLLMHSKSHDPVNHDLINTTQNKGPSLFRCENDRKIAGVCGGLAIYLNVDASLVRLGWVLVTLVSGGLGFVIYILCIFFLPKDSSKH